MPETAQPGNTGLAEPPVAHGRAVVLFDGVCVFCNGSVRFIAERDPAEYFRFAPVESPEGRALLAAHGVEEVPTDTFALVEDGRVYFRSECGLRIARRLGFPWLCFYPLLALPRWIRDTAYTLFAKNRYRLFGKLDACPVPSPELRRRFL